MRPRNCLLRGLEANDVNLNIDVICRMCHSYLNIEMLRNCMSIGYLKQIATVFVYFESKIAAFLDTHSLFAWDPGTKQLIGFKWIMETMEVYITPPPHDGVGSSHFYPRLGERTKCLRGTDLHVLFPLVLNQCLVVHDWRWCAGVRGEGEGSKGWTELFCELWIFDKNER